jgi:hypothetical protein
MDDELRMKLADLGSPEALADSIIAHYPAIEIPIPVKRIAKAVGILDIVGQTTGSFEGVLVTTAAKGTGSIAYNNASRIERRRFTIAHEIGHFLIPWHDASAQCASADMGVLKSQDARRSKEAEANRFAAALLTPRHVGSDNRYASQHIIGAGKPRRAGSSGPGKAVSYLVRAGGCPEVRIARKYSHNGFANRSGMGAAQKPPRKVHRDNRPPQDRRCRSRSSRDRGL